MSQHISSSEIFDVAIVGYGPTGLALAYWLRRAGHRVVAIERWPALYALPRAGHVDAEVMRLFQRMGVADAIAADSSVTGHTVIRDRAGRLIADVPAEGSDQGWRSHYSLFQPTLEKTLDGLVRSTGNVTILQGWQVEEIRSDGAEIELEIASGEGDDGLWRPTGKRQSIAARWLVGADGAGSIVQRHLGGNVTDLGHASRALVIFADRLDPGVGADMPDSEVGMTLPRPYTAWRESGKRYARWEFHVHAHETDAEMGAAAKAWELIAPWGFAPDNARLVRHSVFEFRTLVADEWRRGNIVLAGDAAHRMPPFQGQGMCSGQRDAAALAWRLDLILRGVADPALLDSYMDERRPHVVELTTTASARGQQFWITDPEAAAARDAALAKLYAGRDAPPGYGTVPRLVGGFLHRRDGTPVGPAGRLSAQFEVSRGGDPALLDDLIGADWLLLSLGDDMIALLGDRERALLDHVGVRVLPLGIEGSGAVAEDIHGAYARWFADLGCRAVLIRPDSYIFGAADDAGSLRDMLASFASQLHLTVAHA